MDDWFCLCLCSHAGLWRSATEKSGCAVSVKFVNTVDGAAMKELKGTNCYCINYVEKWEDGQQHFEEIEIVCQKLENGAVAYDNPWK